MQFLSVYPVLSKLRRDLNFDFDEVTAIEWIGEALASIGAVGVQEEQVALIEVKEHKCAIPVGLTHIIQIARDNTFTTTSEVCPAVIAEEVVEEDELEEFVVIDCNGQPVGDYKLAYYRPYYSMKMNYEGWVDSKYYTSTFSPVRLADHTFFASLVCTERRDLYTTTRDEYTINWPYLNFSFKEGLVALAYRRTRVDEKGYPMIPDLPPYLEAITRYIRYKRALRDFDSGKQGSFNYLQKAEQDWHWYCQQAKNRIMMPGSLDEHQDRMDQSNYLLPRRGQYNNFFGNLTAPEVRSWNGR